MVKVKAPFYVYEQGTNRLSVLRFVPEPTDIVVGVPPQIPDKGIQVRLDHASTEDRAGDITAISVVLPVNEAVAMALSMLSEAGTLAAQHVAKALGDLGLELSDREEGR